MRAPLRGRSSDDLDVPILRFDAEPTAWKSGAFDTRLQAIADDRARMIWIARPTGAIFASYDGGFDLFPTGEPDVAALKSEFAAWLSSRPDGL